MMRGAVRRRGVASLLDATERLNRRVRALSFADPVTHVYNPLEYALAPYSKYLKRFAASTPREVVLLGMNPGPWGMAQTGVPFGEVSMVRDWLGIRESIARPRHEHPKRPVQGLACARSEVSGQRLWGWARDKFGTPERFFERFFVANYCPLAFIEESGRNRTPDKLPADERKPLFAACDEYLRELIDVLDPTFVVGVGDFAERRARDALDGRDMTIGRILHPSPASPKANKGWSVIAAKELAEIGVKCE